MELVMAWKNILNLLNDRQNEQYNKLLDIVGIFGKYNKHINNNGAHYIGPKQNPFNRKGMKCQNCVFYKNKICSIVEGSIDPNALCKLWIIPENYLYGKRK